MNFHICNKLCCLVVLVMFGFCRKAMGQVVDIGELMVRKDLTLQQIESIAEKHFNITGKGKGSGYKVFERWRYEQKFHLDQNGYILHPEREFLAFEYAKRTLEKNNNNERAVANWTEMGPKSWTMTSGWNPGVGRLTSVAVHPSNTSVIYVSSPGGGIWKSTNAGAAWTPLIDNANSAWMDIYNLCITPSDQNVVYAGISYDGVIKSSNAGATWTATGSGPYDIRKILVHPTNASIVLLAASNGIWRSTNAGTSWTLVNGTNSAVDIEFKANDPTVVLASFSSNSIARSTNNGVNWVNIPLAASGRTMLGVSPNNPDIVYAVQARNSVFGRFYKSTDAGLTFTSLITGNAAAGTNFFGYSTNGKDTIGQAWYDMAICVNPTNVNEVHIAGIICWKSTNGGTSFIPETEWFLPNNTGYNHADIHSLEYINSTIYSASDGGIYKSTNNGDDWTDLSSGLGIRQFYRIACAKTNPNMITGGAQDNGSTYRQSNGNWLEWLGADGMDGVISPTNANIAIGTSQNGSIYKTTDAGTSYINLSNPSDGNWVTPLAMHPSNHDTIYGGWTGIYRSDNGGLDWNIISGTTITNKLECLAVAPSNTRYIYGSIGFTLYRSSNGGATWTSVGASGSISSICISPTNPQKIWITTSNSSANVLVSTNAGTSWTNIAAGLPAVAARSVVVDNTTAEGLYVGMNIGVYYRDNVNTAWIIHAAGLPLVEINEVELQLSSKKVRVATYGRGIWESDMQPPPTVYAGADVTVTCSKPSATLTAINGISYIWNTGATTASINVSPTVTTTYVVTATMSAGNKTSDAVVVTVNKIVPIANAGADVSVTCLYPTATLTATGGVSYLWNNGIATATNTINPSLTTTYIVTVTAANGCTARDSAIVYSNKAIPNLNLGSDVTITSGFSVTFSANAGNGTYLWSNGATTASITVSPIANSTIYSVTVTTISGCTASDAATVFVVPACANLSFSSPTIQGNKLRVNLRMNSCSAPFSIGANNIRFNYNKLALSNPVILSDAFLPPDFGTTNSTGSSPNLGLLSVNTTYNGIANANTLIIPTTGIDLVRMEFTILNPALSTGLTWRILGATPRVTLVDDDKITAITNVTGVNLDNSLQGVNAGADVTVDCINTGVTLTASGLGNYLWSTGETTASINVSPTVTTTYRVTATNGIMTAIDEIVVVADNAPPLISAGEDTTVNCIYPTATLTAIGGGSYLWNTAATTASINVSPTVTTTYTLTVTAQNGCSATDEVMVVHQNCDLNIRPKVYLNHIDTTTLLMDNYVATMVNFPLSDPYAALPFNTRFTHVNSGAIATTTPLVLAQTGNNAIMDWLFVELRTGISGMTNVAYTKAALLQRDGDIVAMDGVSPVQFVGAPSGNYYVALRHRNNLGFRTTHTLPLSRTPTTLNFTNNSIPVYGANPLKLLSTNVYVMNSGDANFDGSIDAFDTIIWETENGTFDNYSSNGDYNLDGSVDAFDTILWEINNGVFQELD